MIFSINNQYHHPKPYYKHAPITLFLYTTLISLLVSPLSVTAQYGGPGGSRGGPSPLYMGIALAVATVFVAVMFIILKLFCKIDVGRRADGSPAQRASKGLDPSVLESFPVFKYSEVAAHRAHSSPLECAVCLSPFEPDEKLRLLPKCNHVFHVECLDPWLKGHSTCPLCRIDLVPETGELSRVRSGRADESGGEVNEGRNDVNDHVVVRGDVEEGHIVKYKRWKSTGHVAEVGGMEEECWTRFTLMLPEEEMKKFGEVTIKFKRTRSSI